MNAKELHDLYAPLWELVPETSPDGGFGGSLALHPNGKSLWWLDAGTPIPCGLTAAAALCRVAVEDWLIGRGFEVNKSAIPSGFWVGVDDAGHVQKADSGPTIHHALVAAAMAVARAKA